jgi:hypothetical protein
MAAVPHGEASKDLGTRLGCRESLPVAGATAMSQSEIHANHDRCSHLKGFRARFSGGETHPPVEFRKVEEAGTEQALGESPWAPRQMLAAICGPIMVMKPLAREI